MAKYIDAEQFTLDILGLTIVDPLVAQFADAVLHNLKNAPAADVVPVVHGYWIEVSRIEHDYETEIEEKCSVCGRHVYRYDTQPQDNHCPTCGADMGF